MTRSSKDWQESAEKQIDDILYEIEREIEGHYDSIMSQLAEISEAMREMDDPDREEVKELERQAKQLKSLLKELGNEAFDMAAEARKIYASSYMRQLRGKEPLGYSKPDAGVTTAAVYGSKSMNTAYSREVSWPLQLGDDNWNKETASRNPRQKEVDPVTAEGTKKYTRNIGGRTVHIVIDERGMSPI